MARDTGGLTQRLGAAHHAKLMEVLREDVRAWAEPKGPEVLEKAMESLDKVSQDLFDSLPSGSYVRFNGQPLDRREGGAWDSEDLPGVYNAERSAALSPEDDAFIDLDEVNQELETFFALSDAERGKTTLSYNAARQLMFSTLDNKDGYVTCVYTGRKLKTDGIPNGSNMNAEHVRPQSKGAVGPAKSDLNNLHPADSKANSRRGNNPFGTPEKVIWQEGDAKLGLDNRGELVFEPPDAFKGNVQRTLKGFAENWNNPNPTSEMSAIESWGTLDPVTDADRARNAAVKEVQGFGNPFIETAPAEH